MAELDLPVLLPRSFRRLSSERASRLPSVLLLGLFFISGISALIYQVVWLKNLGLIFGNTVHAAATLIGIFLAGLGIGSWLATRIGWSRDPLLLYSGIEGVIGLLGAFSPSAFVFLDTAYIHSFRAFEGAPTLLAVSRAAVVALFLLPPTTLMGATLPLLVRRFEATARGEGRAVSALYAANTFGAAAGVALAGFYMIPKVGLLATLALSVALNFALAIGAAVLGYRVPSRQTPTAPPVPASGHAVTGGRWVLLAALLMGLTSIADEVFWSRIFVLHLGSSVYGFSLMLFSFLVGIALGSALVHRVIDRVDVRRTLALLEVALATVLALQVLYLTRFSDVLGFLGELLQATSYARVMIALLLGVLSAIIIPTAIMGATFPLVVRLYESIRESAESRATGVVYFFNTVGSIAGSLLAGFVLIRLVGSQNGLLLMAAINLVIGAGFALSRRERPLRAFAPVFAGAVIVLACAIIVPPHAVILSAGVFQLENVRLITFREDVTATVALRAYPDQSLSLELNGVNVAGTGPDLIGTQKLQGHLPLLLHPNPRSVLHIGFGSGGTAYAVSRHPVERIRIVEISPEVLEVSDQNLREVNHGVLDDPRAEVDINDGRNYILATPDRFDVILSDSIHPRYAGNGSLYTKDYFELCRERLAPNGVISMWLPMYSMTPRNFLMILRAFRDVFPNTTVWYVTNAPNSFTIVIGRLEAGPISLARLRDRWSDAVARELEPIGIGDEYDLASALLLDPVSVTRVTSEVEPHVDDLPAVEYESGRLMSRGGTWLANFTLLGHLLSPLPTAFTDVADHEALAAADRRRRERYADHLGWIRQNATH